MKRIEKLKLPFYKPGTEINITVPKIEGEELIIEYEIPENSYTINDCIMIPGNYYRLREDFDSDNGDGTWYIKLNSISESGKITTDFSIVIWDDENGRIDGISLEKNSWWGDNNNSLISTPCTNEEIKALTFLENKYRKEQKKYKVNDWELEVIENWNNLIKNEK